MSFYFATSGEDCEILSGSQKTAENFVNTSLVINEHTSKAMLKATENVTKLEKQANVKRKKTIEETPEKRYKMKSNSSILPESSLIMETKNLEKVTTSLPAETETYVNTKEAQGLDEEISAQQYSCITSSQVNRIVSALYADTTTEITSTEWTPISPKKEPVSPMKTLILDSSPEKQTFPFDVNEEIVDDQLDSEKTCSASHSKVGLHLQEMSVVLEKTVNDRELHIFEERKKSMKCNPEADTEAFSGSDHDSEQSNGAVINTTEVEFTDSEVCNETDNEENLVENYELLPLHSVAQASSISMSEKNQHEENTTDIEDLDSDISGSVSENKDNENDSRFPEYVTLFGKKLLVDPYINKKGCRHDKNEKCFDCFMKLRTDVPEILKQLMANDDGLCKCRKTSSW